VKNKDDNNKRSFQFDDETLAYITSIAEKRKWSMSQTVREIIKAAKAKNIDVQ
jgi:hypothetical protein